MHVEKAMHVFPPATGHVSIATSPVWDLTITCPSATCSSGSNPRWVLTKLSKSSAGCARVGVLGCSRPKPTLPKTGSLGSGEVLQAHLVLSWICPEQPCAMIDPCQGSYALQKCSRWWRTGLRARQLMQQTGWSYRRGPITMTPVSGVGGSRTCQRVSWGRRPGPPAPGARGGTHWWGATARPQTSPAAAAASPSPPGCRAGACAAPSSISVQKVACSGRVKEAGSSCQWIRHGTVFWPDINGASHQMSSIDTVQAMGSLPGRRRSVWGWSDACQPRSGWQTWTPGAQVCCSRGPTPDRTLNRAPAIQHTRLTLCSCTCCLSNAS